MIKIASLSFSNITTNSVLAKVSGLDTNFAYRRRFEWYAGSTFKGTTYTSSGASSSSKTISGLSSNTRYAIIVDIYNDDLNTYLTTLYEYVTTKNLPQLTSPTLNTDATIKTNTSLQITMYTVNEAEYYHARINGGSTQIKTTRTFNFTGLSPNTQYLIEIKCSASGYLDSDWAGYYATTLTAELWEWWTPKTTGVGFNLTAAEWLAFCNKINEVRAAKGLSAYSFTTSSTYIAKDKEFKASYWLEVANAINQINGQVATACLNVKSQRVSMGDDSIIYPWYFENLKTALNNAISS